MVTEARHYRGYLEERLVQCSLLDRVWFAHVPVPVDAAVEEMVNIVDSVSSVDFTTEENAGIAPYMSACYLRDIWMSEEPSASPAETHEAAIQLVEGQPVAESVDQATETALRNLYDAMRFLGLDSQPPNQRAAGNVRLSMELIQNVHRIVTKGLLDTAGELRTRETGAAGTAVRYLPSNKIRTRLTVLVEFVNEKLAHRQFTNADRCTALKLQFGLASVFFAEFLRIHPFMDGNGRTARLLFNALLRSATIVPFSLYLTNRDTYLRVLMDAQQFGVFDGLTTYAFHCALQTARNFRYLLL